MQLAAEADRIILTADKDYGELVFRRLIPSDGVVLLRFTAAHESVSSDSAQVAAVLHSQGSGAILTTEWVLGG